MDNDAVFSNFGYGWEEGKKYGTMTSGLKEDIQLKQTEKQEKTNKELAILDPNLNLEELSLKEIQLRFLNGSHTSEELENKTNEEISDLFTKRSIIEALKKKKKYKKLNDIEKWPLEKLIKEHKKFIIEGDEKDLINSIFFDLIK
jgi:hypothetical protein